MKNLLINGDDAYKAYGIRMGDDFLNNLDTPPENKEYIENESRLEDGSRILCLNPHKAKRTLTLTFQLFGTSHTDYLTKKEKFLAVLAAGSLTLQVPADSAAVYHLLYNKCTSYAQNVARTSCKIAAQFTEPNPAYREA